MNLYIMRHGETDWNKQGLLQGSVDIPLNDYGEELAAVTREGLKKEGIIFDRVFSSPYLRAKKTAEIMNAGSTVSIITDDRIREMSFGPYEGIRVRELRTNPHYIRINQCFDDPVHYQCEGNAESYEEVFARIHSFLNGCILPLEHSCKNVLVVCHGAIARAFISIIKEMPLADYWTLHQPNCCVNIARLEKGKFTMLEESRLYYEKKEDNGITTAEKNRLY